MNDESILTSVKKAIGLMPDQIEFDSDIIIHTNSVFMILAQMGVGPARGFRIEDATAKWSDFLSDGDDNYESVKTYVSVKVRLIFDPPSNSSYLQTLKDIASELEWRLNFEAEKSK